MATSPRIMLEDVWSPASELEDYKVHFARWNGSHEPLDVWVRNKTEWLGWQEYRSPKKNDFNRPKILSLAEFYHEPGTWLFTGILRVKDRLADRYVVEPTSELSSFIGRLKIACPYRERQTRPKLEGVFGNMSVKEILAQPYTGRQFPGFDLVDLSFEELEAVTRQGRSDWRAPLASVHGIYLITDIKTDRRYIGSACGEGGVWGRWASYVETGHGGNVSLRELIADEGLDYCRRHFRFTLLEHRPTSAGSDVIIARETHWKRVLFTRKELNRN